MARLNESIYVNAGNGEKFPATLVEMLTENVGLIEFVQAGVGWVSSTAQQVEGDWMWDGTYEALERDADDWDDSDYEREEA